MRATPNAAESLVLALVLAACSLSCGSSADDGADGGAAASDPSIFLAFGASFDNFRSWESFHQEKGTVAGSVHVDGPRTTYLNHRPPAGSTQFPVGTIIVKELEVGDSATREVFAMVKRGGDYNSNGATGWEWFALNNAPAGNAIIRWRGVGPPLGEKYGGDATGGCNSCHSTARENDFVHSTTVLVTNP